jgi:cobalt-zinc-cadmium efflux system outer membrane protein
MDAASRAAAERGVEGAALLAEQELHQQVAALLKDGLTADKAARLAVVTSRRARATYEEIGIARADLVRAGLLTNPVLDFSFRFIEAGAGDVIDIGLSQRLTELLTLPTRRAVAETDLEAARARAVGAALSAAFVARGAVLALEAAVLRENAIRDAVEARKLAYEYVASLHEAGNVTDVELTRRRLSYEESRLELSRAETDASAAREEVNVALGLWGDDIGWELAETLPEASTEIQPPPDLERRAVKTSLRLEEARLRLQRAARRARGASAEAILDDTAAGVSAERNEEGNWEVGPSFSIPIPIFDTGAAGQASAEAEMRRSREMYADEAIRVRSGARLALTGFTAARDEEAHWRDVLLPLAERQLAETLLEYNAMQVGTPTLLDAREQVARVKAGHADALLRYWQAALRVQSLDAGSPAAPTDAAAAPMSPMTPGPSNGGH